MTMKLPENWNAAVNPKERRMWINVMRGVEDIDEVCVNGKWFTSVDKLLIEEMSEKPRNINDELDMGGASQKQDQGAVRIERNGGGGLPHSRQRGNGSEN